ncbi:MAG: hypothetical protein U9Q35_03205 [Pseudomonadota bacterium]|nr:hypothetical protein [Pseudomonadota bacterium]
MVLLEKLLEWNRQAATYNPDMQAAPACILWPDRERLWEPIQAELQAINNRLKAHIGVGQAST